jgi:SPP1 family predicted phage head-tail adaptor
MIQFGKYDRKIQFVHFGQVSDGYGGYTPTETVLLSTLSDVKQLRGTNDLEQAQLGLPKTFVFKVQFRAGFEPNQAMQIKYQGINHVIKGVEVIQERNFREWWITATRNDS